MGARNEENPNAIAPDTKIEGGGSNSNDESSVSLTILPEEDSRKIVVDKTMAAAVLTNLEHDTNSKETTKIATAFHTIFHLED